MADEDSALLDDERSVPDLRRSALAQDVLIFCVVFSAGALFYLVTRLLAADDAPSVWTLGLSDELLLSGLVAGELLVLWNNGLRQGVRGHSIGKHRQGLRVVDARTGGVSGWPRGLLRGLVLAVLLDLAVAAVPIGLPTVLRQLTPGTWHLGAAAYVAFLLLLVPLLLPTDRGVTDHLLRTRVVRAEGVDAHTTEARRRVLAVLGVLGVLGVLAVVTAYLAFFWPLIWRLPDVM